MARTQYKVKQALARAVYIHNRIPRPTYSMGDDGGVRGSTLDAPSYDCSSFIGTVWGIGYGGWPPATPSMVAMYTAAGFQHYTRGTPLKQGDILVYNGPSGGEGADGHTAMVYDKACTQLIECTGSADGPCIGNWVYYFGWQDILRGSSAIEPVKWTGRNPWVKRGYQNA